MKSPASASPTSAPSTSEWLELHNQTDHSIDLSGWIIDDSDGGSKPHVLDSLIIAADQYLILRTTESKINLNNTSDQVRIFDPEKNLVDAVQYQEAEKGSSYALIYIDGESEWSWQKGPTPAAANPSYISLEGKITNSPVFENTYHFLIQTTSAANYEIIFDEQTVKAPLAKNIFTPGTTGKFIGQIINSDSSDVPNLRLNQYQLDETVVTTNNNSLPLIIFVTILIVGIGAHYIIKNKNAKLK